MSLIKKSLFVLAFLGLSFNYAQTLKKDYPITPVSFTKVKFNDIFWAPKQQVNQDVTIPHIFKKEEETKRIDNFKIAAKDRKSVV